MFPLGGISIQGAVLIGAISYIDNTSVSANRCYEYVPGARVLHIDTL